MGRRRNSIVEDLLDVTAQLPWWIGVGLAVIAYLVLARYAGAEIPVTAGPGETGRLMTLSIAKSLATAGQYLLPMLFLSGAAASAIGRYKRKKLVEPWPERRSGVAGLFPHAEEPYRSAEKPSHAGQAAGQALIGRASASRGPASVIGSAY
jgi:restriction system protein